MKSRHRIIALLAVAIGMACGNADPAPVGGASGDTLAAEGTELHAEPSVIYVDVRTKREYDAGHVKGAIHIPHTEMADRYAELEQYADQEIVVYCRSGRRSGIAEGILEDHGFDNVTNGGGLRDLEARGVPTTR